MKRLLLLFALLSGVLFATQNPVMVGAPTIGTACTAGSPIYANLPLGLFISCQSGTWQYVGGTQTSGSNLWIGKQTFTTTSAHSGINVGCYAGDPSPLVNGDLWCNSTLHQLRTEINGRATGLSTLFFVNVLDYGAKCDWNGSAGTDDTTAINAAITGAIAAKLPVYIPGFCKITSPVALTSLSGFSMFGPGRQLAGLVQATLNVDTLDLTSSNYTYITGLTLAGNIASTSGWALNGTANSYLTLDVYVASSANGVYLNNTTIGDVALYGRNLNTAGIVLDIEGATNDLMVNRFEFFQDAAPWPAACIIDNGSGYTSLMNINAMQCSIGLLVNPPPGPTFAVELNVGPKAYFDNMKNTGIMLLAGNGSIISRFMCTDCWAGSATNIGVLIDASGGGTITGVKFNNLRAALNGHQGVVLAGAGLSDVEFNDPLIVANGQHTGGNTGYAVGLTTSGTVGTNFKVLGGTIGDLVWGSSPATQYLGVGIGSGDYWRVQGVNLTGNTWLPLTWSGVTHIALADNTGYNPVGSSSISCGASPCTIPSSPVASPSVLYLLGGTVSDVARGGKTVCTSTPCTVTLPPMNQAVVTYSSVPTKLTLDVQ